MKRYFNALIYSNIIIMVTKSYGVDSPCVPAHFGLRDVRIEGMQRVVEGLEQKPDVPGTFVKQGNGNFKSIHQNDRKILYTTDLGPCVAIIINDDEKHEIHFIHSDSNDDSGIGRKSLQDVFVKLGLSKRSTYEIALVGAMDIGGLNAKMRYIQTLLPHSRFTIKSNAEGAYVLGLDGEVATSKRKLVNIIFKPDPNDPNL